VSDQLNWGILGTGRIAEALAKAINESKTGKLVAVGSRTKESAEKFGNTYNVPRRHGSYQALLDDPQVQAIYISLPNHLHAEWTIKCAQAKKHILCEKPFATNFGESMALVEAARYHDVFLMEAFMYRCHPQTARLAKLIRDRAIGDVRMIQVHFAYNMGQNLDNIRLQNAAAGGAIMDVGCYCMSMARLVAGNANGVDFIEPTELKGVAYIGKASRVDEYATAVLKFPGDILANLSTGNEVSIDSTLRIWGSEGNIQVPNPWFPGRSGQAKIILHKAGQEKPEEIDASDERGLYTIEVDVVAKHIKDRQAPPPCMTWADSLGNIKALDQWRKEVGEVFDQEKLNAPTLNVPYSNQKLARRRDGKMKYGKVPHVDKQVSRLVLGTMIVNTNNPSLSVGLLDHFFEIGGNCLDTAWVYGGIGRTERMVGNWMKSRGVRDDIVLIGKGAGTTECTPQLVLQQFLESLDRLDLPYVDIYMMHRDNMYVPVGEFVDLLNEQVRKGRCKAFGGSNWSPRRLQEANEYAKAKGLQGFSASSPNFSLAMWNEPMWRDCVTASDPDSRKWYEKTQFPLFAWSSQANGLFTGRFGPDKRTDPDVVRTWYSDDNFKRLDRVKELAKKKGVSTTQIALAYVLCQPMNVFALIGPQSIEETRTSALALETELSPEEMRWLNLES